MKNFDEVWKGLGSISYIYKSNDIQPNSKKPTTFSITDARFDPVHVNLVGSLPPSKSFTYILTCVDHCTQWRPEVIPVPDIANS